MRSRFLHWCIFQVILLPQFDETYAVTAFKIIPQNIVPLWPLTVSRNRLSNYWDTCGSPVMKCLCFFVVFFFFSATKWKNCAIVPRGHWALNTMTTNCDPMRCSHADHACYLDDDWRCHARTGPGHMTSTRFLPIKLFWRLSWCTGTRGNSYCFHNHTWTYDAVR